MVTNFVELTARHRSATNFTQSSGTISKANSAWKQTAYQESYLAWQILVHSVLPKNGALVEVSHEFPNWFYLGLFLSHPPIIIVTCQSWYFETKSFTVSFPFFYRTSLVFSATIQRYPLIRSTHFLAGVEIRKNHSTPKDVTGFLMLLIEW